VVTGGVADWRLLAVRPVFDRSIPLTNELRPLVFGVPKRIGHVILRDPVIPPGHNWLDVLEVEDGEHPRFMSWISDTGMHRFYVPAPVGTGFSTESPLYAGHWRPSVDAASKLPWPEPAPDWRERASFLGRLDQVEAAAVRITYRGLSHCRLCGRVNGHEALRSARWEWPAGFRHYIADHDVRPSIEFAHFITRA